MGGVNKNCLEKPADDIITPNEYTFNLLLLTLFSIDILDSQILANNVSAGRHRHENYHMILIESLDISI